MSRCALTRLRRTRSEWDRPATDTRLLLWPRPIPVSLDNHIVPLRMSLKTSAPSRPPSPQRHRAADACVPSPQMISHGPHPKRACPLAVDARAPSPRMITHGSYPQRACPTTVDARVLSRMISRSAFLGVEADACANPQMISDAPARPQRERWQTSSSPCPHPFPFLRHPSVGATCRACLISPLNTAQLDILDQCDGCRRHESKS